MNLGLKNKVAIVAASSKGLGRACAMSLASEGAKVTIFSRNQSKIQKTASEISNSTGTEVLPLCADVSVKKDIERVVKSTIDRFSGIDIVVNNAGGPPFGYFGDFDLSQWQQAVELNLFSTINMINFALPYMKNKNWGRIINITSISVKQPISGLILSNTVRSGVVGLAKTLSNELAPYNITVNNVCPGRILTDRIIQLANNRAASRKKTYDAVIKDMEKDIPLGRLGKPEELGDYVAFLASERASYITGTTLQVDGGAVKSVY